MEPPVCVYPLTVFANIVELQPESQNRQGDAGQVIVQGLSTLHCV